MNHFRSGGSGIEETGAEISSLSDDGLNALAEGCGKLEKLSLIWCSNVTSAGLKSIAVNCKGLRSLDLQVHTTL